MAEVLTYRENQIGGCVTIITAEVDGVAHRIMIDYGSSLDGSDAEDDFRELWENNPPEAVFFTHYHGDHVGRLMEIPNNVPIYMGDTARKVMINIHEALTKIPDEAEAEIHRQQLDLLKDDERIKTFKWDGKYYDHIELPGFKIEPYSVDHSAYDAYMFLIEAADDRKPDGKKVILHTGDFRGHGRRGNRTMDIVKYYVHKNGRKVDNLIIEGTMMSRLTEKVMSEQEMQIEAYKYFKHHKYVFLICSSTNLDSLASFYQAAQSAANPYGRYLYTYNSYLKKQLKTFSGTAGSFSDVYQFYNVHKLDLDKKLKTDRWTKTQKELMEYTGFLAVIKPEEWCEKYIDTFVEDYKAGMIDEMPVIIYSMWDGYVDSNHTAKKQEWIDFLDRQIAKGVEVKHLHTSGHATAEMIKDMIIAVDPQEAIIPIHTECKEAFMDLDIGELLKSKIVYSVGSFFCTSPRAIICLHQ